ncbi:MAG: PorT family protein [Candidatus Aminicenantes bacterium]|nr:MAG: PorT family protein [Candidatus Aminicenantes bacterium]
MKKLVILLILVLFSVQMAHSQAALLVLLLGDKVASENFYFSIKAGGNFASLSGIDDTKTYSGFNFGLLATIKINEKFSLVPEFAPLSPKGAKNIPLRPTGNSSLDALLQNSPNTVRALNYIDIPVVAKYHVNERLSVGAGPYLSILTSATDVFKAEVFNQDDLSFEDNIKPDLRSLDYGVVFEASISLSNARGGKGLVIHTRYQMGLSDILKDNPGDSIKNSAFQVFVSFPFIKSAEAEE